MPPPEITPTPSAWRDGLLLLLLNPVAKTAARGRVDLPVNLFLLDWIAKVVHVLKFVCERPFDARVSTSSQKKSRHFSPAPHRYADLASLRRRDSPVAI